MKTLTLEVEVENLVQGDFLTSFICAFLSEGVAHGLVAPCHVVVINHLRQSFDHVYCVSFCFDQVL